MASIQDQTIQGSDNIKQIANGMLLAVKASVNAIKRRGKQFEIKVSGTIGKAGRSFSTWATVEVCGDRDSEIVSRADLAVALTRALRRENIRLPSQRAADFQLAS